MSLRGPPTPCPLRQVCPPSADLLRVLRGPEAFVETVARARPAKNQGVKLSQPNRGAMDHAIDWHRQPKCRRFVSYRIEERGALKGEGIRSAPAVVVLGERGVLSNTREAECEMGGDRVGVGEALRWC